MEKSDKVIINKSNFINIENFFTHIRNSRDRGELIPSFRELADLQKILNNTFQNTECKGVLFTQNTDNLFFGMRVFPIIDESIAYKILYDNDKIMLKEYYIEFDSKLFDINLTTKELTAFTLHEIGHIVNDHIPVVKLRKSIDTYLASHNETIDYVESGKYSQVLIFGFVDTIVKLMSIFCLDDKEYYADSFVVKNGYGSDLESGLKKVNTNSFALTKGVKAPKLIILDWCFRLYKNMKLKRLPAVHLLNTASKTTGSQLYKRLINNLVSVLDARIPPSAIAETSITPFLEKSLFNHLEYNGLRTLENDYYEFQIRTNNSETEEDVMYTLRGINSRMALLDKFLQDNIGSLSDTEKNRWQELYNNYGSLRKLLAKKKAYKFKNYGLFYDYNQFSNDNTDVDM